MDKSFCWLYKKSIVENLEFIADNETVEQIQSKKDYQMNYLDPRVRGIKRKITLF